jgi:hypothetical protein
MLARLNIINADKNIEPKQLNIRFSIVYEAVLVVSFAIV